MFWLRKSAFHLLAVVALFCPLSSHAAILASDDWTAKGDSADIGTAWDPNTGETAFKIATLSITGSNSGSDASETNNSVSWPNNQYRHYDPLRVKRSTGIESRREPLRVPVSH